MNIMEYISLFQLDYETYKIAKVSHLYTIWGIGILGYSQHIEAEKLGECLKRFYENYQVKNNVTGVEEYKKGMSSATKGVSSRRNRLSSIVYYCGSEGIDIKMIL